MTSSIPEPTQPQPRPTGPAGPTPTGGTPEVESDIANSPFAKMFQATGEPLTKKQLQAIINQFVRDTINQMKKDEKRMKEAAQRMKKIIKGQQ